MLVLLTEPLSQLALAFRPPAYFALGILGLSVIATLTGESLVKGLIAGMLGLMVATIGTDPVTGVNALHVRPARPARRHSRRS